MTNIFLCRPTSLSPFTPLLFSFLFFSWLVFYIYIYLTRIKGEITIRKDPVDNKKGIYSNGGIIITKGEGNLLGRKGWFEEKIRSVADLAIGEGRGARRETAGKNGRRREGGEDGAARSRRSVDRDWYSTRERTSLHYSEACNAAWIKPPVHLTILALDHDLSANLSIPIVAALGHGRFANFSPLLPSSSSSLLPFNMGNKFAIYIYIYSCYIELVLDFALQCFDISLLSLFSFVGKISEQNYLEMVI